jgi:glycosyltransferase involved in cell wall biosynthesis
MKVHGLLLTRDDEDIVAQCINHALTWCDALYVFDTGSGDATVEIIHEAARKDRRVLVATGHPTPIVFDSGLRAVVFHKFRHLLKEGDWIAQVDSDEFFHISPRQFVEEHLRSGETCVWNMIYDFRLTQSEVRAWEEGRESLADRQRPIAERRRHYNLLKWSEPRLFRYRSSMQWKLVNAYPYNVGLVARNRIPIRHYPQRDVVALKKRWLLRKHMAPLTDSNWKHWQHPDWTKLVADDNAPDLHYWPPGTELPVVQDAHHLPKFSKRLAQRVAHHVLLPALDAMRPRPPKEVHAVGNTERSCQLVDWLIN